MSNSIEKLIVKGHIVYTQQPDSFTIHENSYLVVENGRISDILKDIDPLEEAQVEDYGDRLIIPGFVDLHLHGAQFLQCGMGMNKKLLDWLNDYTFSLERKFQDRSFAQEAYTLFAEELVAGGTLRACVFASSSAAGTDELFQALKRVGIGAYVGKVEMDCNAPDFIIESPEQCREGTLYLIDKYKDERLVKPIITPRFAPTCSRELMAILGDIAIQYSLPVQSHLNESLEEIEWVGELFPEAASYSALYDRYNLFGTTPTVMAHCIHMTEGELELASKRGVFMAHCPDSNINVRSGIMPVKHYLDQGFNLGLSTDIAGGHKLGMNEAVARTVQLSKLKSLDGVSKPLSITEAFFLATKGGGKFFGKTGSFEKDYFFDALVLDDPPMIAENYSVADRLEKFLYTGDDRNICARYVEGKKLSAVNVSR